MQHPNWQENAKAGSLRCAKAVGYDHKCPENAKEDHKVQLLGELLTARRATKGLVEALRRGSFGSQEELRNTLNELLALRLTQICDQVCMSSPAGDSYPVYLLLAGQSPAFRLNADLSAR